MAADPGASSGGEAAAYHLFLTRIPPRVPKEEVEAALSKELASRGVVADAVSVVPQSAWKTKGYGFITLAGKPDPEEVQRVALSLDNELRVGGKAINVRVCQPSSSGAPQPAPASETPASWDQPVERISRLCAQVLHCYFARRSHQPEFKAEKLLALLSMTVAPSRGQEPKPLALWAKEVFGSMEQMLLAIGDAHFGASTWSLTGAVAERNAVLSVGKARNMQGWDPLRDPLPIATLLRLAACRQRLDDSHTPQSQRSGFSTPTCSTTRDSCRRCSDCGSLSAVHSSEQPSCSQSEASWSLRSGCNGAQTGSAVCSPPLDAMTSSGSEEQPLSTASPASVASYDSLRGTGGSGSLAGLVDGTAAGGSHQGGAGSCQSIPEVASQEKQQQEVEGRVKPASSSPKAAQPGTQDGAAVAAGGRASGGSGGCSSKTCSGSGNTQSSAEAAAVAAAAAAAATAALQQRRLGKGAGRATCSALHLSAGAPQSAPSQLAATQSARGSLSNAPWMPRPALSATATSVSLQPHASVSSALPAMPAVPPSARDLLHRCATHLQLLFQWHPAQLSFAVPYLAEYLSAAPDVVAWGSGSPYFSLQGYAAAVYGSFEGLLVEVSRVFFGGCWRLEGGQAPGEPRVLCVPRCAHNVMLRSHHGSHGQPHHAHHQLASHGSATGSGLGSSRRASAASSGAASVSGGHHSSPHHHHHHSHRHHHQHQHGHGRSGYSYDQQSALASFASAKQLSRMGGGGGSSGITADGSAVQPACGVPPCVQRPLTTSRSAINLR